MTDSDVVGLRALAEKAIGRHEQSAAAYGATSDIEDWLAEVVREVPALLDEITALRAEVADRDARIKAARRILPGPRTWVESLSRDFNGDLFPRMVDADRLADALGSCSLPDYFAPKPMSGTLSAAVPVPQDNPEATRDTLSNKLMEIFFMGSEPNALREADAILAAFDVRPKNGEKQ